MSMLLDGYRTLITFSLVSSVKFYEVEITPPGLEAGGSIDQTTMRNNRWRSFSPKALITAAEAQAVVSYDSAYYTQALSMLGINQQITFTFPDTHTYKIWGWLDSFVPGSLKEGNRPTATCKIIPSNHDNNATEQAPVYA